MNRNAPINEELAATIIDSVQDPVVQNLLRLGIAAARMGFVRWEGQSMQDWEQGLPAAPFDMEFFARALARAFAHPDVIRRILDGETIAQASGWDL